MMIDGKLNNEKITVTIEIPWDSSNEMFVELKRAYFNEDPFYLNNNAYVVTHFERTDPLEDELMVTARLKPWPGS